MATRKGVEQNFVQWALKENGGLPIATDLATQKKWRAAFATAQKEKAAAYDKKQSVKRGGSGSFIQMQSDITTANKQQNIAQNIAQSGTTNKNGSPRAEAIQKEAEKGAATLNYRDRLRREGKIGSRSMRSNLFKGVEGEFKGKVGQISPQSLPAEKTLGQALKPTISSLSRAKEAGAAPRAPLSTQLTGTISGAASDALTSLVNKQPDKSRPPLSTQVTDTINGAASDVLGATLNNLQVTPRPSGGGGGVSIGRPIARPTQGKGKIKKPASVNKQVSNTQKIRGIASSLLGAYFKGVK